MIRGRASKEGEERSKAWTRMSGRTEDSDVDRHFRIVMTINLVDLVMMVVILW